MIVLTVQVHEWTEAGGHRGDRRHLIIDRASRTAVCTYPPASHDLDAIECEPPLYDRLRRPRLHESGIGPLPHEQLEGANERGLTRAGLAGENGHAGREVEPDVVYEREVANVEFF